MTLGRIRPLCLATLLALGASPTLAGSIATSSAAGGSSASSAASSASDSVGDSSDSSRRAVATLEGAYRVVEVTPLPERPGAVRLTLQALAGPGGADVVRLVVPRQAVERGSVQAGGTVTASRRPYGVELAQADTRKAFFLLLDDDWHDELRSRPVSL